MNDKSTEIESLDKSQKRVDADRQRDELEPPIIEGEPEQTASEEQPEAEIPPRDFIFSTDSLRQKKAVETWTKRELRKTKRINWTLGIGFAAMTLVSILEGFALLSAIPLIRILPVFYYVKPDGVLETAITTDSLPQMHADAAVKTSLWQYVMHREGYSYVELDYSNKVVQSMSSQPVREAYVEWSRAKNPKSYQAIYGRKVVLRVEMREALNYYPSVGGLPGRITFHFDLWEYHEGEPPPKESTQYTTSLEFIQDYQTGFDMRDILMFNPMRIVVTAYPGATPLPGKPKR